MSEHEHEHHHGHGHHGHSHEPIEVAEGAGHYELMVHAIKDLLIEKGVVSPEDIRRTLEIMDTRTPALGAKVVARAWADPDYKKRLLADGTKAVAEFGIGMGDAELIVVENTSAVHNVIVCTLCSCYPRTVLGLPPDWYKSRSYRSRVVAELGRRPGTEMGS
jgi:nitrile hydratase